VKIYCSVVLILLTFLAMIFGIIVLGTYTLFLKSIGVWGSIIFGNVVGITLSLLIRPILKKIIED
jgi:hypothetical protein